MWDPEFALEKEILTDPYRSIQIHTRFWDPASSHAAHAGAMQSRLQSSEERVRLQDAFFAAFVSRSKIQEEGIPRYKRGSDSPCPVMESTETHSKRHRSKSEEFWSFDFYRHLSEILAVQ